MWALRIFGIRVHGDLGLRSRRGFERTAAHARTVAAAEIPLGETTACSRAENLNAHVACPERWDACEQKKRDAQWRVPKCSQRRRLQLGVGVRANFAIQGNLFVLRWRPFHDQVPPGNSVHWTTRG